MRQSWKGPGRTGLIFVYFAKKSVTSSPETSAPGDYFVKAYQTFETSYVLKNYVNNTVYIL